MTHGTASIETGQFAELAAAVVQQLPRDIASVTAQGWITDRAALQKALRLALLPNMQSATSTHPVGNVFRETGELAIQIPALPRPTLAELRARFSWVRSVERDISPETAVTLRLGTVLRPNEDRVGGPEYERRLVSATGSLGYQQAEWLVAHQDAFPGLMALLGKVYIDFPGLVVVGAGGDRSVPHLSRVGLRWYLDWSWIVHVFYRLGLLALSRE